MDPISDLCKGVASLSLDYIRKYKDAPTELRTLALEAEGIESAIKLITAFSQGDDTSSTLPNLKGTLKECERVLRDLRALLVDVENSGDGTGEGNRRKVELAWNRGKWLLKRQRARELIEDLSRIKSTLTLSLVVDSANDLKQMKDSVAKIKEGTNSGELDRMLVWLVTTDPSPRHNEACRLHEKHTGEWLNNSPEYRDWRDAKNRILWIHGIAGAGKTVLLSHIVEDVKSFCNAISLKGTGFVYYYCYFERAQNEATHILRWIISQLCRQIGGLPNEVRSIWQKGTEPSIPQLIETITEILPNFPRVYVTIDALDESEKRDEFLDFIHTLFSDERLVKISFLVTSRPAREIKEVLSHYAKGLSLSNPYVGEDIRTYVQGYIGRERRMQKWPAYLKNEVEVALVSGAKGMFRWAVCQLDTMKVLNNPSTIRSALSKLPKTLDETYERILCGIEKESEEKVARTLQLLANGMCNLTIDELAIALAIDFENQTYFVDDQDLDKWAVIESCKCLVTVDQIGNMSFAHYTVKEYLTSDRLMEKSSVRAFHMTDDSIYWTASMCSIIYVLNCIEDNRQSDCFEVFEMTTNWPLFVRQIENEIFNKQITPLVLKVLQPESPVFLLWTKQWSDELGYSTFPIYQTDPDNELCIVFAHLVYFELVQIAKSLLGQGKITREMCEKPIYRQIYLEEDFINLSDELVTSTLWKRLDGIHPSAYNKTNNINFTNIIHIACCSVYEDALRMLLEFGADPNVVSELGYSCLSLAFSDVWNKWECEDCLPLAGDKIDMLFQVGAIARLPHVSVTPFQSLLSHLAGNLSEWQSDFDQVLGLIEGVLRELLDNGADINGVCNDRVNARRIKVECDAYLSTDAGKSHHLRFPLQQDILKYALHKRGESEFYDTPLRILERATNLRQDHWSESIIEQYKAVHQDLVNLMKTHGAKSLHLFPHPDLPGYCAEDMAEWQRLKDSGEVQ